MTGPAEGTPETAAPAAPLLKVVDAHATPEEIAAIVAVFSALGGAPAAPERPRSVWADPSRRMRTTLPHGPGQWRASALPR